MEPTNPVLGGNTHWAAADALKRLGPVAEAVLMRLLQDEKVNAAVRMQAAAKLMDSALALVAEPAAETSAPTQVVYLDPKKAAEVLAKRLKEQAR